MNRVTWILLFYGALQRWPIASALVYWMSYLPACSTHACATGTRIQHLLFLFPINVHWIIRKAFKQETWLKLNWTSLNICQQVINIAPDVEACVVLGFFFFGLFPPKCFWFNKTTISGAAICSSVGNCARWGRGDSIFHYHFFLEIVSWLFFFVRQKLKVPFSCHN